GNPQIQWEGSNFLQFSTNGAKRVIALATTTSGKIGFSGAAAVYEIGNVSVKPLPGNHATQPTSANRPVYKTDGVRHWAEFNGTNQFLDAGKTRIGNTGLFCGPGEEFCLAVVFRSSSAASNQTP